MKSRNHSFLPIALALAVTTALPAATLYWDGTDTTADADGGAGTWNTAVLNPNWDDAATGGANTAWPAISTGDNDAVFAGAGGIVDIDAGGITANDLMFSVAGYSLTGGSLTLGSVDPNLEDSDPAPLPTITNGVDVTINAGLLGTFGLKKVGNATLTLGGDNTGISGPLVISGATTGNNGGVLATNTNAFGGFTSVDIQNNSFLRLNGATMGGAVAISVAGGGGVTAPEGAIRGTAGVNVVNGPVTLLNSSVRLGNTGGSSSTTFNGAITAASGSGFGIMFRYNINQGTVLTNPANYWEGGTNLSSGSVYFHPGALPTATNLAMAGSGSSWFETNGTFARAIGTAAGEVQFNATAGRVNGFSARGGSLAVNLGGNEIEPTILSWGLNGFTPAILGLASTNATHTLTWLNPLDLNGANRTIDAQNGSAEVDAIIVGPITGATGSILTKSGSGVIELSGQNTYPGGTVIAGSQGAVNPLRISHANALGTGSLTLGGGGNNDQARLELAGGITVANNIPALTSRNNDVPNFFNVSGENTITSNLSSGGGGSRVTFHSASGNLIFTGSISTRQLNLRGEGNGELGGNLPLSTTYGINKAGGGTWIIAGDATYPGTTVISGGTLQIGKGGTTGTLPAGEVTNNSSLVFDRDGSLSVAASIIGTGNLVNRGPGVVTLTAGVLSYTGQTSIQNGTLIINGIAETATGDVRVGDGTGDSASAILGGTGLVGGAITVSSDGAIAPGAPVGTLTASTNVSGAGSLRVEVDGATADQLVVGGSLDISAMTLDLSTIKAPTGNVYVIVNAASAITGARFAAVTGNIPGYTVTYNHDDGVDTHNIALIGTPVVNPYDTWATTNGVPGQPGHLDHDNDGVSNGVEYFIGGPTGHTTGFTALPGVTTNASGVSSVTWMKAASYAGVYGTDFVVETSSTLEAGSWRPEILAPNAGFTVTMSGNSMTYTFPAGPLKKFARLRVVVP